MESEAKQYRYWTGFLREGVEIFTDWDYSTEQPETGDYYYDDE